MTYYILVHVRETRREAWQLRTGRKQPRCVVHGPYPSLKRALDARDAYSGDSNVGSVKVVTEADLANRRAACKRESAA